MPDQIRTMILDVDIFARMHKRGVVNGNVHPGDKMFGFESAGKAVWEMGENSGHMSNGSTLTRHVLVHVDYGKKYPQIFRQEKLPQGRYHFDDSVQGLAMSVGDAIMSPTRQWAIVMKMLVDELNKRNSFHLLHAVVMNAGGGLTKCLHVGRHYLSDGYS
ncbi:MAG: hypothetical protein KC736_00385 [Candidatus Moranbacteria bacterium]|nr:hypothetical protein [Candidatus Moranbacteria bacterium]